MDKFEQNEMNKKRPIKNTCCDCLINYVSKPIRKSVGRFKDKIVHLFKKSTPEKYGKQTVYGSGK